MVLFLGAGNVPVWSGASFVGICICENSSFTACRLWLGFYKLKKQKKKLEFWHPEDPWLTS